MKRIKWMLNKAIGDILDYYNYWSELSGNELVTLIYTEFRKSANWFYEDTKDFDRSEVEQILKRYFGE